MSTRQFPKHTVSTTQPMGGQAGDEWFNPTTNQLYKMLVGNGNSPEWRELAQPSLIASSPTTWTRPQTFNNSVAINGTSGLTMASNAAIKGVSVTDGSTNSAGSNLIIAAGASTGSGTPGDIVFQTAPAGSSGSAVNAIVERMRLTGAGTLSFSNTDVALDKTITAQTVAFDNATSFGMSGGQSTYTLSHTTGSGPNRLLVVSFVGNESGTVGSITYPRGGVATNLTLLGTLVGYPVQSFWYLVNPDSGTNNVFITMSAISYCGFGITTWTNVNQTTPMANYQTTNGTSVSGDISITVPTDINNIVISSLITYNKSNTPSANQTGFWSATSDAAWKAYGYRTVGTSGSAVLTHTLSGGTSSSWSYTGATIQNASSASPVVMSTSASALNLSLGAASSWALATATPALNIGSNLLTLDTVNARVGIGTSSPGYKLTLSTDSAAKPTSNTWTISSDGRIKTILHPYEKGLEEVSSLNPMVYRLNGLYGSQDDGKNHVSVIAQDVVESWPEMVGTYVHEETLEDETIQRTELYNLNTNELQWALVNAVKELSAKVKMLEDKLAAT